MAGPQPSLYGLRAFEAAARLVEFCWSMEMTRLTAGALPDNAPSLAVARLLSHRIMVMKNGYVIETGLTDQVLDDPREPYTQLLVASILQP